MPKKNTFPKSKVSRVSVARLYNTGNYEHIRYEISADVPPDGSASQTLIDLTGILQRLKPIKKDYEYQRHKDLLNKLPQQMTESEKEDAKDAQEIVGKFDTALALKWEAVLKLDDLGGASVSKDAKLSWDDHDDEF